MDQSSDNETCDDGVMVDQKAMVATITGRVQGVGYRYAVEDVARELGLTGWVRNSPDGSVETRAQGNEAVLGQFVAFLRRGPRMAQVRDVDVHIVDLDPSLRGFDVRF